MVIQGTVQAPPVTSATEGNQYTPILGKTLELITSELHGKYFTQSYRRNIAMASLVTASALVAPATNATPNFFIWNPTGNVSALSLISFYAGYVSGTPAAVAIGYSYVPNAGATIAGTSAISAATFLTVRTGILGVAYSGNALAGSAATVGGAAPSAAVVQRYGQFSNGAIPSASVAAGLSLREDFEGTMIIPPGVLWYPHSSAASVATFMLAAVWEEVPWP